jgi:hypothetical protein
MGLERLKTTLGFSHPARRYNSVEDVRDLEEISDPTSAKDETETTWREWIGENAWFVLAATALAIAVVALLAVYAAQLLPAIVSNPFVQVGALCLTVAYAGFRLGQSNYKTTVVEVDRLELHFEDDLLELPGVYVEGASGEANYFVPIKGFRGRRHSPRPYTHADLGMGLTDQQQKGNIDPDDPVTIRLHPNFQSPAKQTDWGTVVGQRTDGLEVDETGRQSTLYASMPTFGSSQVADLERELEQQHEEVEFQRDRAERLRRRLDTLLELIDESHETTMDRTIDFYERIENAGDPDARRNGDGEDGEGTGPKTRDEILANANGGGEDDA